ncbi:MAG: 2Fe-2S iron-sulfur cluster binding domain-containing protein [Colwellia sp.]|nr:2Fe-2S iron-sulfur cluster binding domain-containing protein [Colwellia sp.]
MAHQYAKIAFTDHVRQVQSEQNSRAGYAGMDTGEDYNFLLSAAESQFIAQRDSFYMASVSETDWPYVQHRGGPRGFLKVLDAQTLGFADYKGNRQYVSTGNFRTNDKVAIILMDYPNRRRLKILGRISVVEEQDRQTLALLEDNNYQARVERGFIIKISAFDWNCPQHITPRYNETELSGLIKPLEKQVKALEEKLALSQLKPKSKVLGDGELPLVIVGIRQLTPEIRAYELRAVDKVPLPKINAGAHIQVPIKLANGQLAWRNYSISSNPERTDCYEIAVKLEEKGNGGSLAIHQSYQLGLLLNCKLPENFFPLLESKPPTILIAGGIGITAIKSMALALLNSNAEFELHYAGRTIKYMAYADRLSKQLGEKLHLYPSGEGQKLSLKKLIEQQSEQSYFYLCGPTGMINDFKQCATELMIKSDRIHYEHFSIQLADSAKPCQLTLTQSNIKIDVASNQTLLDAVLAAGIDAPFSCLAGECKSCVVKVAKDTSIEHLDNCLTEHERASGKMCLCVSRPKSTSLHIDL